MQPSYIKDKGDFQPSLWRLNENKQPEDTDGFLKTIKYLEEHSDWIKKHKRKARKYCELLEKTEIPAYKPDIRQLVDKIRGNLQKNHPHLFDLITIGDNQKLISKVRLTNKSVLFRKMLTGGFVEEINKNIKLEPLNNIEKGQLDSFVEYLDKGETEITVDNAFALLRLAQYHYVTHLRTFCAEFIGKNIDIDNFKDILNGAIRDDLTDLKWQCLIFAYKNRTNEELIFLSKSKSQEISEAFKEVMKLGFECQNYGIEPTFCDEGIEVKISTEKPIEKEAIAHLEKMNKNMLITGLDIRGDEVSAQNLNDLASAIPSLNRLVITNKKIKEFPIRLLRGLKQLDCSGCNSLTTLNVPNAEKINCNYCYSLTRLDAPKAEMVCCRICRSLTTLKVPRANILYCNKCDSLVTLEAPKAEKINCGECRSLVILKAPNVKELSCWSCEFLTTLKAPNVEILECGKCKYLTTLVVPKAKKVSCWCCKSLTTLKAPKAKDICCHNCYSLTALDAPNAEKITCGSCKSLKTLKAPKAKKIDCNLCESLKTLDVPNAKDLDCQNCYSLTALDAPNAKKIHCFGCKVLITLKAPKVEELHCWSCLSLKTIEAPNVIDLICHGCKSLKTLKASIAKKVECGWCESLTTLEAPKAKEVDCMGCKSLITLEAPNVEDLSCGRCHSFTILIAPKAKRIDCTKCEFLTTLVASMATTLHCMDCKSLKRIQVAEGCYMREIPEGCELVYIA